MTPLPLTYFQPISERFREDDDTAAVEIAVHDVIKALSAANPDRRYKLAQWAENEIYETMSRILNED